MAPNPSSPAFPVRRLRRLRRTPALRRLVAEARIGVDDLIAPLFGTALMVHLFHRAAGTKAKA